MALYDFRCAEGHIEEHIRPMDNTTAICACGRVSTRTSANRVQIKTGYTPNVRAMFARSQEAGAEMEHQAKQYEATTGQAAPAPGLWEHAKAKANAMVSAGEASEWRPHS